MGLAHHTWTFAKVALFILLALEIKVILMICKRMSILLYHFSESSCCGNVPRVDKPIEMSRGVFDLFSHVVVAVEIKDVRYEVKRILIVLYIRIEAGQVEAIGKVVFIDLAEIFVPAGRDELFRLIKVSESQSL